MIVEIIKKIWFNPDNSWVHGIVVGSLVVPAIFFFLDRSPENLNALYVVATLFASSLLGIAGSEIAYRIQNESSL